MAREQTPGKHDKNEEFPGYPHYPAEEDITNPGNGAHKVRGDVENLANSNSISRRNLSDRDTSMDNIEDRNDEDEIRIVRGTEADVTRADLENLGRRDEDQDMGDDEEMRTSARVDDVDADNDELEEGDLDVPGSELDDQDEETGDEDEENNYYSLGGDNHEDLEEDQS